MSNRIYPHPIIAREGWPILAGALIAVIVSWMLDLGIITFLFFVFLVFAFQFFRDPAREAPEDPRAVVSPVDGRVCKVEKCTNPETGEDAVKVSIFMNVFNVHSQKSPVAGVVEKVTYTPGLFVNADLDKASTENERNAVTVRMADGPPVFIYAKSPPVMTERGFLLDTANAPFRGLRASFGRCFVIFDVEFGFRTL